MILHRKNFQSRNLERAIVLKLCMIFFFIFFDHFFIVFYTIWENMFAVKLSKYVQDSKKKIEFIR